MEGFPVEFIIYGVLLLVILLFNAIARRMARQQSQPQAPEQEAGPFVEEESAYESSEEYWGRPRVPLPAPPERSPGSEGIERLRRERTPPLRATRYTRESLIGSRGDLRRAIVLMTVLGPPKGDERPEASRWP
jgi:hypothetical protein